MSQYFMNQSITIYPDELKHILSELATKETGRNVTKVTLHCEEITSGRDCKEPFIPALVKVTIDLGSPVEKPSYDPMGI